ncbi:MAG: DNA polymerase Y family protein [Woeseiaceae bacterium]|nr:DNA polymerase Y family protein [Woeseiaceae bacterium]
MARVRQTPVWLRDGAPTPPEKTPVVKRVDADGQYGLPLAEAPAAGNAAKPSISTHLWFAVYLPSLPLQAVSPDEGLCAVVEEQQGVHRVLIADARALEAGVQPGQTSNAALALAPDLHLEVRSELREQQALEFLATWLEQFSSFVSMADRDLLLLEIAGSLKLFGGLKALRQTIVDGLKQQGFDALLSIAPTPLAATWLARAGQRACIRDKSNIASALRSLSLHCLSWPPTICESLDKVGVATVGDCLRLPRDGFARRFGVARLLDLDRAVGRLPDPRDAWRSPESFVADFEMTEEQSDRELLLAICEELLQTHERFLLKRQLGTQQLLFSFYHLKSAATELHLGAASLSRSARYWFELLKIRFEQLGIPEPVIAVRLRGGHARALSTDTQGLSFTDDRETSPRYSMSQLAERLIARVGRQSVRGVVMRRDHRPQFAISERDVLKSSTIEKIDASWVDGLQRPLWMLSEPVLLSTDAGHPVYRGRLRLLAGPERFETGWWDEDGVARDYYVASNAAGLRLWVFRNRNTDGAWYLHGLFG